MRSIFKYIGIAVILIVSFYYTEKMSNIVILNSELVKEINDNKNLYNVKAVSAVIEDGYITPGLNGYAVNVLKSYDKMRSLDAFNSYYLEYDKVLPDISLENNKDKIIKYGNKEKNKVAIIIKDNIDILNYSKDKNIKLTRLVDYNTFDKNSNLEQINNDYENYDKVESMLNNNNINKNICYINKSIEDICLNYKKYLVEASLVLDNYNLKDILENIRSGYIIYINDTVNLSNFKLLVKQISYHNLEITSLSDLIKEER